RVLFRSYLNGIQLAVDLINQAGGVQGLGGAKLEVVVADAGSDPTTAASVTQRLVSRDRVVAVLGAFASSLSLAASEVTERNRVPFLTMSFTDILTQRGFKYLFQVVSKGTVIGAAQMRYAMEIGEALGREVRRVAIVHEYTAYGSSQADGLAAEARRLGLEVVDRKSTRLNSSHVKISYAVFCLKKKKKQQKEQMLTAKHEK